MTFDPAPSARPAGPRETADAYVTALAELDPLTATYLGLESAQGRLPDLSPAGADALADLARRTLDSLAAAERAGLDRDPAERRCARLLRERLLAELALYDAGEHLRTLNIMESPAHAVRNAFTLMPRATEEDWAVIARRLRNVPGALEGFRATLAEGARRGLLAGPRQVSTVVGQLGTWVGDDTGESWFAAFTAPAPGVLRAELDAAAAEATAAFAALRDWLRGSYAAAVAGTPDTAGRERYARYVRYWTGADVDLDEAYAWAWGEFRRVGAQMREEARRVLPGATPEEAVRHLEKHGEAVEGAEEARRWLQRLMDEAVEALDGVHVDLAEPVRRVESVLAPPGSAAAPYYTQPSLDFSRPGRTWLPVRPGETRFPVWNLVSTWYHEGVPGHHLQLAHWTYCAGQLSRYQVTVGMVSANVEGWALYAERLMDELGFLADPGRRLGYLDAQMTRVLRVIVDIGMHLGLPFPDDAPRHAGQVMTPGLARDFFGRHCGRPRDFLDSEFVRYLGMPGQAIGYKLGERAWLRGREAARAAHGDAFDLRAWHMAALSQGSLGLDDLVEELTRL